MSAEGWYEDPYRLHTHRWFSAGAATSLVRDDGAESQDEPPDEEFTGPLVPAHETDARYGSDLVRADDAASRPFSGSDAVVAALDKGAGFGVGFS